MSKKTQTLPGYENTPRRTPGILLFMVKFWGSPIVLVGTLLLLDDHFKAGVLAFSIPPILLAVFYLVSAEIDAESNSLRYRRFFHWKTVNYDDIRDCRVAWFPPMGYLRLNRRVPPFGAIYFLLPIRPFELALPGRQSSFTSYVNSRRSGGRKDEPRASVTKLLSLMAVAGVLYTTLLYSLFPNFPPHPDLQTLPAWAAAPLRAEQAAIAWPWGVLTSAMLLLSVIVFRSRRRSWILAFFFGALLSSVVVGALR